MVGKKIQTSTLLKKFKILQSRHDMMLVEGVGGLLVPITHSYDVSDLAFETALPLIIVSRLRVGTLNHTLLSIEALATANLEIAGIVLVGTEETEWGAIEANNKKTLESAFGIPLLGCIPFCRHFRAGGKLSIRLEEAGDEILSQLHP